MKPWGCRACPAQPCSISVEIKDSWSSRWADKQLSVLCTHTGVCRGSSELLTGCITADATQVTVTCSERFMPVSSPLSLPPSPAHHTIQQLLLPKQTSNPHFASPTIFSTPPTFSDKHFTAVWPWREVQRGSYLLRCLGILSAPSGKQKVKYLPSQVPSHWIMKAIQSKLRAPEIKTPVFLCFVPWNWWSLVAKQMQINCSPCNIRHLYDLPVPLCENVLSFLNGQALFRNFPACQIFTSSSVDYFCKTHRN